MCSERVILQRVVEQGGAFLKDNKDYSSMAYYESAVEQHRVQVRDSKKAKKMLKSSKSGSSKSTSGYFGSAVDLKSPPELAGKSNFATATTAASPPDSKSPPLSPSKTDVRQMNKGATTKASKPRQSERMRWVVDLPM